MTMPMIEQVVSRYLFNQDVPPANLKSDELIRPEGAKGDAIDVDMNEFMTTGGGRFVGVERFLFVMNFLCGQDYPDHQLAPGVYTTKQLLRTYDIPEGAEVLGVAQYYQGIYDDDYAERAYVFGSGNYVVNNDALFIVNQDGSRRVENICVVPQADNFDYKGGGPLAGITNYLTKDQIDPSGIGREVPIHFTGSVTEKRTYTSSDVPTLETFRNNVALVELANKAALAATGGYFVSLFASVLGRLVANDIITYEDSEGRYVVYDGKDVNNNGTLDPLLLQNMTEWIAYKGAAAIGGGGDDTIYGTGFSNDELYGGSGNDTLDGRTGADRMEGGSDDDTYIVDDVEDKIIEKSDEGTDTVKASVTYTLEANVENLTLTGSEAINGTPAMIWTML